jgi:hypothetical protein
MLAFLAILYIPIEIISFAGWSFAALYDPRLTVFFDILHAGLSGLATTLLLIASVSLYGSFQKRAKRIS